jgi:hypothetical protein
LLELDVGWMQSVVELSLYIGSMGIAILLVKNVKNTENVTNVHVGFFAQQDQIQKMRNYQARSGP